MVCRGPAGVTLTCWFRSQHGVGVCVIKWPGCCRGPMALQSAINRSSGCPSVCSPSGLCVCLSSASSPASHFRLFTTSTMPRTLTARCVFQPVLIVLHCVSKQLWHYQVHLLSRYNLNVIQGCLGKRGPVGPTFVPGKVLLPTLSRTYYVASQT